MAATRRFGYLGGGLLTAIGALGLAITGLADPLVPSAQHLLVLEINPAQNLLHLLLGLAMVAGGAASPVVARYAAASAAAALAMLGLVGIVLAGPGSNPLALDTWGNLMHLGLAGWGVAATLRRPVPDQPWPGHRETSPGRAARTGTDAVRPS